MTKLKVQESECACERCRKMCRAPCCGTPADVKALMDAGYGDRLMLDDWEGQADMIKPALKGWEGEKAPWNTESYLGCTFWIDGKCELHDLGLKPEQGKLAHHSNTDEQNDSIGQHIELTWKTKTGEKIIKEWKKEYLT
jgi:hypothetical protein